MTAKRNSTASHPYVTYYRKPRKNRDGSLSILTLVRVPKFKRFSKTFPTQQEAEAWAIPLAKELVEQGAVGARASLPTLTITQLIDQYLDDPKSEELNSHKDYAARANWWKANYGWVKVLEFDVPLLFEARGKLRIGGRYGVRSAATVNRHLDVMRLIWNWGRNSGWLPQDRTWPTKLRMKEPKGRTRFLDGDELDTLLRVAAKYGPTMKAAAVVSIACGPRKSELLRLKWPDINFTNSKLRILVSKNGEARTVYLPANAALALKELKKSTVVGIEHVFVKEDGEPATQGWIEYRWKKIRKEAGLVNFRWHDLRHTCASILAQNGSTLLEIGTVLGHKSPSMTMRYAHLIQGAPVKGHVALDEMLKGK